MRTAMFVFGLVPLLAAIQAAPVSYLDGPLADRPVYSGVVVRSNSDGNYYLVNRDASVAVASKEDEKRKFQQRQITDLA
ncbi:unnamed protein product [Sympodiomycopsis kandeliae]